MVGYATKTIADYPDLAGQWHPRKNGKLTPSEVSHGSVRQCWWTCDQGSDHVWQATAFYRTHQIRSCPFCSNRRASKTNSLKALYPAVAKEWHPSKNGELTPGQVTAGSATKVWWQCKKAKDHVWRTVVRARTTQSQGCPYCAGKKVSRSNCLATVSPTLAKQWHPTRNGKLTPRDVTTGSPRKAWWRCAKNPRHVWQATIASRKTAGCPRCKQQPGGSLSLAEGAPVLSREWCRSKNGAHTPDSVSLGSRRQVWWRCRRGHVWQAPVISRVRSLQALGVARCPTCSGRRTNSDNSLVTTHPELARQWHPTKNAMPPEQVTSGSARLIWWKCPEGPDHEWQARCHTRVRSRGCPFCANKRLSVTNSLASVHPELARQWHARRNAGVHPRDVVAGTNRKYFWRCELGHEWQAAPSARIAGQGCPHCMRLTASERAILSHPSSTTVADVERLLSEWDFERNGSLDPSTVAHRSSRKLWWRCPKDETHRWLSIVANRAKGIGCPFCSNRRVSRTNNLAARFPRLARQWHPTKNGTVTPRDVVAGTDKRYWWQCVSGHTWRASPGDRTRKNTGCPHCVLRKRRRATKKIPRRWVHLPSRRGK